jgi:hypothetical protein
LVHRWRLTEIDPVVSSVGVGDGMIDSSSLILKLARNVFFAIFAYISFIIIPIILFMLMNKHVKRGST